MEHSIKEPLSPQEQKEKFLESLSSGALYKFRHKIRTKPSWAVADTRDLDESYYGYIQDCIFDRHLHKLWKQALLRESIDYWVEIYEGEVSLCEVDDE